jgi:hypothetical protein
MLLAPIFNPGRDTTIGIDHGAAMQMRLKNFSFRMTQLPLDSPPLTLSAPSLPVRFNGLHAVSPDFQSGAGHHDRHRSRGGNANQREHLAVF